MESEIDIKMTPKQREKSLMKMIERLDVFEDKAGVYLENISIQVSNDNSFTVFGEIHTKDNDSLRDNISIECVLYGAGGSYKGKNRVATFNTTQFFGFDVFQLDFMRMV